MTFDEIRQLAEGVRDIPLVQVLPLTGALPDNSDKARWHTSQGVISVTGMKFMNWNQATGGGGAIDLVMHLQHLGFKAAVFWLRDHFAITSMPPQYDPPPKQHLRLPARDERKLPQVIRYLVTRRSLPYSLINNLIDSGRLYADKRANAVFLLWEKEQMAVGAELRGTSRFAWRGMAPGSRKTCGYFAIKNMHAKTIILCESAIDAISCFTIHEDCSCISTAGANPSPPWITSFTSQGYQVYCGFDSDPTGEHTANKMIALHPEIRRLRPAKHDWNDVLTSVFPHTTLT